MQHLTPREIVAELDKHIVGQQEAKRAVAVAIRNRWRRQLLPEDMRDEVGPKNIIMIGPTGVGKTEIARRLAGLVNAPFIKVEATRYTEVGYHGRDVESMVRDLLDLAINMVRTEQTEVVRQEAERRTVERILDALVPPAAGSPGPADEASDRRHRNREKFRVQFEEGQLDDREIDIEVEEKLRTGPLVTAVGLDQMDVSLQDVFEQLVPGRRRERRLPIREARRVLFQQECDKLIDREKVTAMAVQRTESSGIIFLDEIDKICQTETRHGADVSRQGVQRDLLPIVEGTVVQSRHGPVKTDHILFIAAGAFHSSKPSDLMPELQGRFPIRVELNDLDRDDFVRILTEPKNALTKQHIALLATEGVTLKFDGSAIAAMADISTAVNRSTQNTGARRLYTIMEKVLETISFEAPERTGQTLVIDEATVRRTLESIVKDEDLSRFIL